MTKLFETEDQLRESGYLFRITDNGGATCDRFTIVTSDGDYFGSSADPFYPLGFFQSGEGIDVQRLTDRVDAGEEKDLRWIDLPDDVRRAVVQRLNLGFADYIESGEVHSSRDDAASRADVRGTEQFSCIYRDGDKFRVRDEVGEWSSYRDGDTIRVCDDNGDWTFDSMVEAVRFCLPDCHELSGPEYHSTVDLWDTEGGPVPLWDCEETESAS